jgi:hypothetical protein
MGARGKKRKRADGTIAGRQQTITSARIDAHSDRPVAEVSVEAIREILPLLLRVRDLSESELEEDGFAFQDALDAAAERHGVEDDALDFRANRLGWLVESWRPDLLEKLPDGTLVIDPRIIEFAATSDPRNPDTMIKWVAEEFPKPE